MEKVTVSANALRQVLEALTGPGYILRELQAIRSLGGSPIDKLVEEYNLEVEKHNREIAGGQKT